MSEFDDARTRLAQSRGTLESAERAVFAARQRIRKLERLHADALRGFDAERDDSVAARHELEKELAAARSALDARTADLARHAEGLGAASELFERFSDPRKAVAQLSAEYPCLLMPLRLETRFRGNELLVRVFPDDCAVDTFESTLSRREVDSAIEYWTNAWRAGGFEDQERGAWRGLVGSHGSGRAAFIVENFVPLNLADKPVKAAGHDVVLVVVSETPHAEAEWTAVAELWSERWRANGDRAREDAAWSTFESTVGAVRAAELEESTRPVNFTEQPGARQTRPEVAVSVAELILPAPSTVATQERSWSRAPSVEVLPDRFVLIGYLAGDREFEIVGNPVPWRLVVGPDPEAPPARQFGPDGDDLRVPDELRWMVDFERARQWGLGFKVPLNAAQARHGFDRLLVVGVRTSADHEQARHMLEGLFEHHRQGRTGLALVPQGTPTNNTDSGGAGYTRSDDADVSFDDRRQSSLFEPTDDWLEKRDGQWLAELVGIDPAKLARVHAAGGADQSEARAMNIALWPATLGYLLDTMLDPVLAPAAIETTRAFFIRYVVARGPVPGLRIGRQPYGILPTTAFSRLQWPEQLDGRSERLFGGQVRFMARLHAITEELDRDWARLTEKVSRVGSTGDAHQTLLDVLGLHPASVEYHQRYSESVTDLYNRMNLGGFGGAFFAALIALGYRESGTQLLRRLGYDGDEVPDVLEQLFLKSAHRLNGPAIDDRPLSETESVRAYTPAGKNYIEWLADAARSSLDSLRRQEGFTDGQAPKAILYLLLRHALMLGYWDTSLKLYRASDTLDAPRMREMTREPKFIHVAERAASESRWQPLYQPLPEVTGSPTRLVADHIRDILATSGPANHLGEQLAALDRLARVPTARLERLLADHLDSVSYRFDAWRTSLAHQRLAAMRYGATGESGGARSGLYLGAYGWLEDVRPKGFRLSPIRLEPELARVFQRPKDAPLARDATNGGFIHAPSLNQAVTAAVLRSGFIAHASADAPGAFAVNLSSERVRRALAILEGLRGGQNLGALLGYELERGLHDRYALAEVDEFIFDLRKAFPLVAGRIPETGIPADASIEDVEARNVVDGVALVEHVLSTGQRSYPFGKPLPPAGSAQVQAIDAEVERLLDLHDAISDLALAEGVHQAAQGNYERAAATLDTFGKGSFPSEPDVIRTPRSGIGLTHRLAVHLTPGLSPTSTPIPGLAWTPRSHGEPALNAWLASVLPDPEDVVCVVRWTDPVTATEQQVTVSQQDLGLQPIDLVRVLQTENQPAMAELDDRVVRHVVAAHAPRPDAALRIVYTDPIADKVTFFELSPLVRSLHALVLTSRPLRATDSRLSNEARTETDGAELVDRQRVAGARTRLATLRARVAALHSDLATPLADLPARRAEIVSGIDGFIARAIEELQESNRFGIPQTGWGHLHDWKSSAFATVLELVSDLVARWDDQLVEFAARIAEFDALPPSTPVPDQFMALQRAERLVSTEATLPLPATPADFRAVVMGKRAPFVTKRDVLAAFASTTTTSLATLLAGVRGQLPLDAFDREGIDLGPTEERILLLATELRNQFERLDRDLESRLTATAAELAAHDASVDPKVRLAALQAATTQLLGEDFRLIPEFSLESAHASEWQNAFVAATSGSLFRHLLTEDRPVDTWLYGIARVRPKLRHFEQVLVMANAFERAEPELLPVQFPYRDNDYWFAVEFPEHEGMHGDHLIYAAHYAQPFDGNRPQCGLLLDEWTEVIPSKEETTGIAVHFDRPSSEAPQTMLLVTPASLDRTWHWEDLVAAVNETLDLAKKRCVEPAHLDDTPLARFLPATMMAVTLYQISISMNLAINNAVYAQLAQVSDGG